MAQTINDEILLQFIQQVFSTFDLTQRDAQICAENLVLADLRGIPSHGVARLKRYVDGMKNGTILPLARPRVIQDHPCTAAVDGCAGLGQIVGHFASQLAIDKASTSGVGVVTVRNSNHYGIAGYYSQMMLEAGLLGISMTNSAPLVVPTFGRDMIIGTNPISLTAPAKRNKPFFLDMATSVVPRGKLEVYDRLGKTMPEGWAVDELGRVTGDAANVLKNMVARAGGGILPLGGAGESLSGYKGYGLAVLVDILCGVLSGGAYADLVDSKGPQGEHQPANVAPFIMALKIENFVDRNTFCEKMDDLIDRLKNSARAKDEPRIFIHGEKEQERYEKHKREGVPLDDKTVQMLQTIGRERGVTVPF